LSSKQFRKTALIQIKEKRPGVISECSGSHYLAVVGCIGEAGVICILVVPAADIAVVMVPAPPMLAGAVMAWLPVVIVAPDFIVVEDMVEGIDCPPLVLPPMANAWVARANAAITVTVVNFFIC
jgi:hypothetical protein